MAEAKRLSKKSVAILKLIAEGCSSGQIVDGHHGFTYWDIFAAAEEAQRRDEPHSDYEHRMAQIRTKYPRAYEKWSENEDADLRSMSGAGSSQEVLARHFQRQPSTIRSRLEKLAGGAESR